jgi:hypothetical protein
MHCLFALLCLCFFELLLRDFCLCVALTIRFRTQSFWHCDRIWNCSYLHFVTSFTRVGVLHLCWLPFGCQCFALRQLLSPCVSNCFVFVRFSIASYELLHDCQCKEGIRALSPCCMFVQRIVMKQYHCTRSVYCRCPHCDFFAMTTGSRWTVGFNACHGIICVFAHVGILQWKVLRRCYLLRFPILCFI